MRKAESSEFACAFFFSPPKRSSIRFKCFLQFLKVIIKTDYTCMGKVIIKVINPTTKP